MFKIFTRYLNPIKSNVMALTAAAATAIGAGISAAGSIGTGFINQAMNKKQFQRSTDWNEKMYKRQLADQRKLIQEQRQYESPIEQLRRLREAGLNPNLLSGAFGGPSATVTQPVSAGSAPAIGGNPMSDFGSTLASSFNQFASGIDTSTLTQIKYLKGQEELEGLKLTNEFKRITNEFAPLENQMKLAAGQVQIDKNLQEIRESVSRVSVNENQIKIGDSVIKLNEGNLDKVQKESLLIQVKTTAANLDVQKAEIMMPYVQKMAEANFLYTEAKTEAALNAAYASYASAERDMVVAAKEQGLVDAGWADSFVKSLDAQTKLSEENASVVKYNAKSQRRSANAQTISAIGQIVVGSVAAGSSAARNGAALLKLLQKIK